MADYSYHQFLKDDSDLSEPIMVNGEEIYKLPSNLKNNTDDLQLWSGYVPPCTIHEEDEECLQVQKSNIKSDNLYNGIEKVSDHWMELVCDTARESVENNGGPFGALILQIDKETSKIIRYWTNYNQVTKNNDPTAHAEIMVIRSACKSLGVFNLGEIKKEDALLDQPGETSYCVIYSSTEPCPMCYSAICWASIPLLLFAATRFDAAVKGVNFSDEEIYNELEQPYSHRKRQIFQCTTANSLDAFNLWKRSDKIRY